MSHFSVMVIGDNVESLLAPYHEFECTGEDDQFVKDLDQTEEFREEYAKRNRDNPEIAAMSEVEFYSYWRDNYRLILKGEPIDKSGTHKYGHCVHDGNGNVLQVIRRTNPNKKWDWWTIGGRWRDKLLLKDGSRSDSALKGLIDADAMRHEKAESAAARWDRVQEITGGTRWASWEEVRERFSDGKIEEARNEYSSQEAIKAFYRLDGTERFDFLFGIDDYLVSRDQYIQAARDSALSTFAVVTSDGKWHERGEMGWFACVSNEKDQSDWNREVSKLIDSLPDDARLTIVDCHI